MWHHICVTWKSTKGTWQLYLDGQLRNNGTGLKENYQVPANGTVVIGQDQDKVGGGFETGDGFGPGEVTEVNLWSRVLSASDIEEQYANCHITKVGLMHWWEQFKDGVTGVKVVEP
ncbi:neuronal pentraxin-2-like [Stylophora pistillata]|uniref:neuronal pentraxin-2-like n=1 Tax=Stylophora pistillata TaxID=50429 RepID=UPI000C04E24E|nr:neuronal pentraxin-2-like [Stylophora pistillata]